MKNKKTKFLIIPLVIVLAVAGGVFWKIKQKQKIEAEIDELEKFIIAQNKKPLPKLKIDPSDWQTHSLEKFTKQGNNENSNKLKVDTSDWQTYHSDDFGFSFKYPKDWEVSFWEEVWKKANHTEFFKPDFWRSGGIKGQTYYGGVGCVRPKYFDKNKSCPISFDKIVSQWRGEKNAWLLWLRHGKANPPLSYTMIDGQFVLNSGGDYMFRVQDNNMIRINFMSFEGDGILPYTTNEEHYNIYSGIINTLRFDDDFDPTKK